MIATSPPLFAARAALNLAEPGLTVKANDNSAANRDMLQDKSWGPTIQQVTTGKLDVIRSAQ